MVTNSELPCLFPSDSLQDAVTLIDRSEGRIAIIVDQERHVVGTVTDGDVRRAMLAGISFEMTLEKFQYQRVDAPQTPVVASISSSRQELVELMHRHQIQQLPLLNNSNELVGLHILDDPEHPSNVRPQALIMAGGFGKRLRPLTDETPKPMLPVGGRPLMEHVVDQLRSVGIQQINISTYYKPEKIVDHFRDGQDFGVEIQYVQEKEPLGTAGALQLLMRQDHPVIVLNGDILTSIDYQSLTDFHRENNASLTVAVRAYEVKVPYGVVESNGSRVQRLVEKPSMEFFVNAGIYFLEPECFQYIPNGRRFDMTDLIEQLINQGRPVVGFPIHEYWLDIGSPADYEQAQQDIISGNKHAA